MIIQYILNLDSKKRYKGTGQFELFGSANYLEAFSFAGSGIIELFGSAQALIANKFIGAGSFELTGTSEVNIPLSSVGIKFSINNFGYDSENKSYQITKVYNTPQVPLYLATRLGQSFVFNNQNLFTPPELEQLKFNKFNNEIKNYKEKIDQINNKLSYMITSPNNYKKTINFSIEDVFSDSNFDKHKVESVLGDTDIVIYKSENKLFPQDEIYTPPQEAEEKFNKNINNLKKYTDMVTKINNKLSNINPVPINYGKYNIKFTINETGNIANSTNNTIFSIYGVDGENYYQTENGYIKSENILTPSEKAYNDNIKLNQKLLQYNTKLSQINTLLGN